MKQPRKRGVAVVTALLLSGLQAVSWPTVSAATLLTCSFEKGTDGFASRGGATVAVSKDYAAEGAQSLKISDRTSAWQGAALDADTLLTAGNTYAISCEVLQATGSAEEIKLTLQYSDASGTTSYSAIALETVESETWTTLANASYTVPEDATSLQLYVETPENLIDFYLDNVLITGKRAATKRGDANGDNAINAADAQTLADYLVGKTAEIETGADWDGNGVINAMDLTQLKYKLLNVGDNPWDSYEETDTPAKLKLYQDAIYQMGNTTRLRNKIEKAQSGDPVTVAYLSGSITEGNGLDTCYAHRSYEYFANTFGTGSNVKYVNAGLSGTSSVVGLLRCQRDILDKKPDVIYIEFSVNDHPEEIYRKSFESLVKKCLAQENEPAVIILINRAKGGYSMQTQMAAVGKNFNIPVLSMDTALTNAFNAGTLSTGAYFTDEYHPHAAGNALIADAIAYFYRQALKTENETGPYTIPQTSVYGSEYSSATMVSASDLSDFSSGSFRAGTGNNRFPNGWTFTKNGNTPMTFKANGKGVFLLFKSNQNSSLGTLNVTVNGTTSKINGNRNYAWGGPDADLAYIQTTEGELSVSMAMASASSDFEILGIGILH